MNALLSILLTITIFFPIILVPYSEPTKGLGVVLTTPNDYKQEFFNTFYPTGSIDWIHWDENMYKYSRSYMPVIWSSVYRRNIPDCGWCLTSPNYQEIRELSIKYPERIWLFWNEPSLRCYADETPSTAVIHTQQWKDLLEPKSQWACCGVSITSDGLAWMDGYIINNGPIPDYWHIHIYLSKDIAEYEKQLDEWWAWWNIHGENKKIIISKTSLFCDANDCANKQKQLMTYLHNKILTDERIYRILWWKSHGRMENNYSYHWLAEDNKEDLIPTELGEHFIQLKNIN